MGKKSKSATAESSLSGFLLGQATSTELQLDDTIFANSKGASTAFQEPKKEKKSKKDKKSKSKKEPSPVVEAAAEASDEEEEDEEEDVVDNDAELSEADSDESLGLPSDDDDDDGVEEAYAAKLVAARLKALAAGGKKRKAQDDIEEDDEEEKEEDEGAEESGDSEGEEEELLDIDRLMHESLLPKAIYKEVPATAKDVKKAEKAKKKAVSTETPEERDARTIFIGNVPVECSTSRPMKKALIRHVLSSPAVLDLLLADCPPLKCDSIRFRSLAFASTVFGRKATTTDPETGEQISVEAGGRGRKRAKEWRAGEDTDERGVRGGFRQKEKEAEKPAPSDNRKGALTDGQKRRVAFIRGELNEGKKACNAYLVLEALPKSFAALADADILKILVDTTNGSTFEGNMLRADHVRPRSTAALLAAAQMAAKPNAKITVPDQGPSYTVPAVEARRTIFIGGLDFAESEENVRVAVEAALVREKGPSGLKGWVEGVRIIRDASSGLGKGFGYILLRDDACVDELLALPAGKYLKVSKRKVRLERCKTGIAAARAKAAAANKEAKNAAPVKLAAPRDPSLKKHGSSSSASASTSRPSTSAADHQAKLAEALAKLDPTERKAIKAIDPERLQRRALKKKNKVLSERYDRKMANQEKKGGVNAILGRASKGHERAAKEKKRIRSTLKGGKRAKPIKPTN